MSQETVPAFEGYADFLSDIKGRIQTAQMRAALSLSREVVWFYWQIGDEVRQRQARHSWGTESRGPTGGGPEGVVPRRGGILAA